MQNILLLEDLNTKMEAMSRILICLDLVPLAPSEYHMLIFSFVREAFEVLPSSELPGLVAKKYDFKNNRQKRISFGSISKHYLKKEKKYSQEGLLQTQRESLIHEINNLDQNRKFQPKAYFKDLRVFETKNIPFMLSTLENKPTTDYKESNTPYTKVKLSLESILENPACLNLYL